MKNIGMIRKIDELGSVVIPKEIRKSLGIKDGENLEIMIDNDNICLKKSSLLLNFDKLAKTLVYYAYECINYNIIICDREKVIASYNGELLEKRISKVLERLLESRESYYNDNKEIICSEEPKYYFADTILSSSDALGVILIESDNKISDLEKKFVIFLKKLLVNKIDIL